VGWSGVGWGQNEQQKKYCNEKYDFMHSSNLNYNTINNCDFLKCL